MVHADAPILTGWTRLRAIGFPAALYFAGIGLILGVGTGNACRGDGSFPSNDPAARPSGYCTASHLWRFPESGVLVPLAIYLAPSLVVVAGAYLSDRLGVRAIYRVGLFVSALLVVALGVAVHYAHVGYAGV